METPVVAVRLTVGGVVDGDVVLWEWLRTVPELRGRVGRQSDLSAEGQMGVGTDLVAVLASTGAATALARSLQTWLSNRRSNVTVTVAGPGGRRVSVSGQFAADHDRHLHALQDLLDAAVRGDQDPRQTAGVPDARPTTGRRPRAGRSPDPVN